MEGNLNALTVVFTEFYYWVTIVMMFLIHVGFCVYEVGVVAPAQSPENPDEECDGHPAGHRHLLSSSAGGSISRFQTGPASSMAA